MRIMNIDIAKSKYIIIMHFTAFPFLLYQTLGRSARGSAKSVCAKRNIIDAKHHIIAKHIICTECNIVLCPLRRQ